MGMLFNTDTTLNMLMVVNTAFNRDGLNRIRNDKAPGWPTIFGGLPGTAGTYALAASPLNVDLDGGRGLRSKRWQSWLKILDKNTNTNGTNLATYVGTQINNAIANTGATYTAIEFFAVPTAPSAGASITALGTDYPNGDGTMTKVITFTTSTLDALTVAGF